MRRWRPGQAAFVPPLSASSSWSVWATRSPSELAAHLNAATARLLDLIREFDARGGRGNGFSSCAAWLTWRVGLAPGAAREHVRVARALGTLPRLAQALARGELSYSKVRALTRVATPETEERLLAEADAAGQSLLEGGARVPAETSQRLACDASRVVMRHDADGRIVEVGARTRTIPPALRRALHYRDRGCRFPGCGVRFGQGHHIRHWADGGRTTLSNLALLCRRHHRAVREEGYQIAGEANGDLSFRTPHPIRCPSSRSMTSEIRTTHSVSASARTRRSRAGRASGWIWAMRSTSCIRRH